MNKVSKAAQTSLRWHFTGTNTRYEIDEFFDFWRKRKTVIEGARLSIGFITI